MLSGHLVIANHSEDCGDMGVEQTQNKSQYTKITLEKKILPLLLPPFELATF